MTEMFLKGINVHKNVLMPDYEKDNRLKIFREVNIPSNEIYMPIGFDAKFSDDTPLNPKKHYRKYY
jgi:hypothetical protein